MVLLAMDGLHQRSEFKAKYTIYRLGTNKGFRIVGAITQDLDLFRMPVMLKIDTDGRTEEKRIEVVGTDSPFSVETFGRPRRISIDPQNRVLTNSKTLNCERPFCADKV